MNAQMQTKWKYYPHRIILFVFNPNHIYQHFFFFTIFRLRVVELVPWSIITKRTAACGHTIRVPSQSSIRFIAQRCFIVTSLSSLYSKWIYRKNTDIASTYKCLNKYIMHSKLHFLVRWLYPRYTIKSPSTKLWSF